jgi:integrase
MCRARQPTPRPWSYGHEAPPTVDFLRRALSVERQLVRRRGDEVPGLELTELLKTDHSRRTVPLAQAVLDVLAAHLAEFPAHPALGLVFTDDSGQPIREQTFGRAWHTARRMANVPAWAKGPHHLRHHFASLLIARGASVKVVQARLGHSSAKTTLDVYGHLWPDDEDAIRAAVDDELGAALTPGQEATGTGD